MKQYDTLGWLLKLGLYEHASLENSSVLITHSGEYYLVFYNQSVDLPIYRRIVR